MIYAWNDETGEYDQMTQEEARGLLLLAAEQLAGMMAEGRDAGERTSE